MEAVEITREKLEDLISLHKNLFADSAQRQRLIDDFNAGRFYGLAVYSASGTLSAYLLYFYSFSTWENRVAYIAQIWLDNGSESVRAEALRALIRGLVAIAKSKKCNRINYNLALTDENEFIAKTIQTEEIGMVNLTKAEDWQLFEMSHEGMLAFANNKEYEQKVDQTRYRAFKVTDMSRYAKDVCGLVRELAVFEKMVEQFKATPEEYERDYDYEKSDLSDGERKNRFYEACVVCELDNEGKPARVLGITLYFINYNLARGVGCYLEDLYIVEDMRRLGLGKFLWQVMIRDCLDSFKANYMNWAVLGWNEGAINLYRSLKAKNLFETDKLNVFRLVKEKIYRQS